MMIISIPLDSSPLLLAAVIFSLGMLATPISPRLGVIGIGTATVIMGSVVLLTIPIGLKAIGPWLVCFGPAVIVGAWMVMIGIKKPI